MASPSMTSYPIKLVIVGDGSVGKTSMFLSYTDRVRLEKYLKKYSPTVLENYALDVPLSPTEVIKLDIWDTAGQDELVRVRQLSYPDTDVFLICYSCDNKSSLDNVKSTWLKETVETKELKNAVFVLCGTKVDLVEKINKKNIVTFNQGEKMRKKFKGKGHVRCSAITGENVGEAFNVAMQAAFKNKYSGGGCIFEPLKKNKVLLINI
eukprot:snap_masked-scaffold_135-processed-gene-0.1-mRNA-1 protein AED:0.04 eAED:0.04 QI:0/0/0/0.5/1/1/2/0/207